MTKFALSGLAGISVLAMIVPASAAVTCNGTLAAGSLPTNIITCSAFDGQDTAGAVLDFVELVWPAIAKAEYLDGLANNVALTAGGMDGTLDTAAAGVGVVFDVNGWSATWDFTAVGNIVTAILTFDQVAFHFNVPNGAGNGDELEGNPQFETIFKVPGPVVGAGLPAVLGLMGFAAWRRRNAA